MKTVKVGEAYHNSFYDETATVTRVIKVGAGFTIAFRLRSNNYDLVTSRREFLGEFKLIPQTTTE